MRTQHTALLVGALLAIAACGQGEKKKSSAKDEGDDAPAPKTAATAAPKAGPLAPKAAACAPVGVARFALVGDAKAEATKLSLVRAPGQNAAAWWPDAVDASDVEVSAVLAQTGDPAKFADGVAVVFLEAGANPTEAGAGGPSLGAPTQPIVAAGVHYPMDEPHFFLELWQGKEGIPYQDEPPAREKVARAPGKRLVELVARKGELTLAIHAGPDATSPATTAKAKLSLSGERRLGLTGATGVYAADLALEDVRVSVAGTCLK